MPSRRLLLAGFSLPLAAPALAQQRGGPQRPAARGSAPPPTTPANSPLGPVDTAARFALLIDFETGATLLEKGAEQSMPPASMSKLMTMYVVFDMIRKGRLAMDQLLPVSEAAWRMGGSKMFVDLNTTVSVENLARGVIIQSGNDACVVFAEAIAGSERAFADLMNQQAREIGLTGSNFRNSTGWPDPEHRMTPRDLATLARRIILDFPDHYRLYSERSFRWHNITQENRNPILGRVAGGDGLKTGHTEEAGYGLTASAKRADRRLILVVSGLPTMRARAEESERLLEWGFREFENVVLFRAEDTIEEVPVHLGGRRTVPLVGGRDVVATLPRGWRNGMQARLRYDAPVPAPVAKGQELGRLEVSGRGVPEMSLPLYAGADVERLGLVSRIPAVLGRMIGGGA
ncbi:D-alanyl-D-alanine carboxypeptidase family protein [Sabulicella rubraurantiaca]|uniref:D-alanyl-D-alanine carboxypeptidase family protein n=1 Tax=Sabulicella rubraurantiaca TaxID=2811429 RepID=UPI001A95D29A|nr:D-alanyl-D-alanine carboxypeptidase family protein [Sabulicella rubraurantiaca]